MERYAANPSPLDVKQIGPYTEDELRRIEAALGNIWNDSQSPGYVASLTVDCNKGTIIVVGTLTGNITINAPLNPDTKRPLIFLFTQDATGSRTITWNAVFKTSANPVGGISQVTSTMFAHNGSAWIQTGGLTWI